MSYASAADMTARYGAGEMAQFEAAAVTAALGDAATEMDASLGVRYTLPLATSVAASPVLKRICTQLARFFLHDDDPPEPVVERAKEARKMLRELAAGTMVLPGITGAGGPDYWMRTGPDPVMTTENLEGF